MLNICKTYDEDIFAKFEKNGQGLFFNKRMDEEIIKRKSYSESRRKNRAGGKKKSKKDMSNTSKTYDKHMEDENKDININVNELEDSEDLYEKITFAFWQLFDYNMQRFGVNSTDLTKAKSKAWVDNIRKLIEIDKRSEADIALVYGFLKTEEQSNSGFAWAMNIRSTNKLRQNFEKVLIRAKNIPGQVSYDINEIIKKAKRNGN